MKKKLFFFVDFYCAESTLNILIKDSILFEKSFVRNFNTSYRQGEKNSLTLYHTILTTLFKNPFENIVGKGENAGNQHFLLFPQCFLPFPNEISIFLSHFFCCLQMLSIWTSLKFCRFEKS